MKQHLLKLTIISSFFLFQKFVNAQAPDWDLVKSIPYGNYSYVAADAAGNFYVACRFTDPTIMVGNTILTNAAPGSDDIIIVKYDGSGNVLWAKSAGGNSTDYPTGIAVDGNSNVYITGSFGSSSISFGSNTLSNSGNNDFFIAKFDGSGNVLWANSSGGGSRDEGRAITTDLAGNVYVAGMFFSSSVSFGSTILNNTGGGDAFIVKYNSVGNVLWAKSSQGSSEEGPDGIAVDGNGNVFISGYLISSSAIFGGITLTKSGSYTDMFIVKYDASGNVVWAKNSLGTHNSAEGFGVVADALGNCFVTGGFDGGTIEFGTVTISATGGTDIFIAKFDPSGNIIWATANGGDDHDNGTGVILDCSGNIYVSGFYRSSSIAFGSSSISNAGEEDIFIAKFDPSGNPIWGKTIGGNLPEVTYSICKDAVGNIYLTGTNTSAPMDVGDIILTAQSVFVAKLKTSLWINAGNDAIVFFGGSSVTQGLGCTTLTTTVANAVSGSTFSWNSLPPSNILNNSNSQTTVCPVVNTNYIVYYTTPFACIVTDTVLVKAIDVSCGNNNTKVKLCITTPSGQLSTVCVATSAVASVLANNPNAVLGDCSAYNARIADMVSEEVKSSEFRVYPNPSHNYFTLQMGSEITDQKISLRILDLHGRLVETRNNLTANQTLQIGNDYKPGIYIAEILQGNRKRIVKLVKL